MRRELAIASLLMIGCGGAPPPPPAAPAPEAPAPSRPQETVRQASNDLKRYWSFGPDPTFGLYMDVDALLHTELFEAVVPMALNLSGDSLRGKQRNCVDSLLSGTRELAVSGDKQDGVALLALSDDGMRAVRSTCIGVLFPVDRVKVAGANEAYAMEDDVVVIEPSVVLVGSRPMIEAALVAQTPAWPPQLALHGDQQAVWTVDAKDEQVTGSGSLSVSPERFRLELGVELPSEEQAKSLETNAATLKTMLPKLSAGDSSAGNLLDAVSITRSGKQLTGAFELRGSTAEQVRRLGTTAALAVAGVRKYMLEAKSAEARIVLSKIARKYTAAIEQAPPAGQKPLKKFVSLPPVPATVPRGTKFQSAPDDWKAWDVIHFSIAQPQYYQYEVVAAKDGLSAELIARGDLNGDGKTSEFHLKLKLDPKTKAVSVQPSVDEADPNE